VSWRYFFIQFKRKETGKSGWGSRDVKEKVLGCEGKFSGDDPKSTGRVQVVWVSVQKKGGK